MYKKLTLIVLGMLLGLAFSQMLGKMYNRYLKSNSLEHFLNKNQYAIHNTKNIDKTKKTIKVRVIDLYTAGKMFPKTLDKILKEKYNIIYVNDDSYDLVIKSSHGSTKINKKDSIKFYYASEADSPIIDEYDLSMGFDNIDHEKYVRLPFAYADMWPVSFQKIDINYSRKDDQGECNPNKKNFACALITHHTDSDGANSRVQLFHKLSLYKKVLSGGRALNNNNDGGPGNSVVIVPFEKTSEWISQCKFMIAYENNFQHDGYITEKPFQAYFSGAIPLYMAHPSVLNDINPDSVIYEGSFKDQDEMVEYIKQVDQDDELYCKIWNQNIINKKESGFLAVYNKVRDKIHSVLEEKMKNL